MRSLWKRSAAAMALLPLVSGCWYPSLPEPKGKVVSKARAAEPATSPGPEVVDKDAPKDFTSTESGLKYRIRRKSDGKKPTATEMVTVHYRGWLDDGTEFDSSYKRGQPAKFRLDGVIPGWTEGLQLIGKGGMIELEVPPSLGYGATGTGRSIPPNARLHFLVELIDSQ